MTRVGQPLQLIIGVAVAVFWVASQFFPELDHLGDPFSPSIPREEWFLHLYQWGPDGCGTELCR